MGKAGGKAESKASIPQKTTFSRLNYLYQAAKYLEHNSDHKRASGNSRHLVDELQRIANKSLIRLTPEVKHTICQRCQAILEEGVSLSTYIENHSKNGAKSWADVLVRKCIRCGATRRIPIGAKRQLRREKRPAKSSESTELAITEAKPSIKEDSSSIYTVAPNQAGQEPYSTSSINDVPMT